jgi:hypothetical protein
MLTSAEMKERLSRERRAAKALNRDKVPAEKGLYVWYSAASGDVLYVGKAMGRDGLRGRICMQHLNAKYLETRPEKFRGEDAFQLGCGVMVGGKVCVDKSVFRRSVGRWQRLAPGEETVRYIIENLEVAWLTGEVVEDIPACERLLIQEMEPSLNVSGRRLS